jgi:diamine N-acetyltransferase
MSTLRIRPIVAKDTANIVKWRNSSAVRKNLLTQTLLTEEQHVQWLRRYVDTGLCRQFIIEVDFDGETVPIGTTFIKNIDETSHKGEFGIFIGEVCSTGRGYGYLATELILGYAFCELRLRRVYLSVFSDNASAVHIYEKAGFVTEGVLREDYFDGAVYRDVRLMGMLKEEWNRRISGFVDFEGRLRECNGIWQTEVMG